MGKNTNKNYYAVAKGRETGIFHSWFQCEASVREFKGAIHKGFPTIAEARKFLQHYGIDHPTVYLPQESSSPNEPLCDGSAPASVLSATHDVVDDNAITDPIHVQREISFIAV